jgi:hypothetical protein
LALRGGLKAVSRIEGKGQPKIGIEEFMSVADRFGLSPAAQKKIKAILKKEPWGAGPFLANYYSGMKESRMQAFERVARRHKLKVVEDVALACAARRRPRIGTSIRTCSR